MGKVEIRATQRAQEKFREIVNGSKKEVVEFFSCIEKDGIKKEDYKILFNTDGENFYYKECKNVFVLFLIESQKVIIVVDFLTKTEFEDLKNSN